LIPGVSGGSAILLLARLARVVRLLFATAGLRRFAARLGKVAIIAGLVVVLASLGAYQAEHRTNPEFPTVGDALWWGIVTLTTVGYGDIVPKTTAGRFCGIAIMLTGIAVLGVLGGSLASLFNLEPAQRTSQPTRIQTRSQQRRVRSRLSWPRSRPSCTRSNVASASWSSSFPRAAARPSSDSRINHLASSPVSDQAR
jgi:ion channel